MILKPGDLPVFMFTLISFGSKEEVRIVAFQLSALCFSLCTGGNRALFLLASESIWRKHRSKIRHFLRWSRWIKTIKNEA